MSKRFTEREKLKREAVRASINIKLYGVGFGR